MSSSIPIHKDRGQLTRRQPQLASPLSYVLITPARNERDFLQGTICSVLAQTILPSRWVIVSDGSTDGTDDLVRRYSSTHPWIHLLRMPERRDRHFAAKVACFNRGRSGLEALDYDVIGSLDADITFGPDYFEFLLAKFAADPRLGVAGTPFMENGRTYDFRFATLDHVSGACQLFRRACFEEIGGYVPIKAGGIDLVAVLTARMKGWTTRTFTDQVCIHHRVMGTAKDTLFRVWFKDGQKDYLLGGHPLWECFRGVYQMTNRPYLIGGALMLAGYLSAALVGREKAVPPELVTFRRTDQLQRLGRILRRACLLERRSPKLP